MKRTEITTEQISAMLSDHPETRDDPRVRLLLDIASEHTTYELKLEWLARNLDEEKRRHDEMGLASIHEGVLSTSLIDDIKVSTAKIRALMTAVAYTCKAADNPKATAVDELIRTLDPRS
jgi:hypothetical protein